MLIEVLGLGMPVAAAFGWWMGCKNTAQQAQSASLRYSLNNSFLNSTGRSRSRSIVEEIYRLNPGSVDLRFALAALYREQGDYSRAVDMHQSILEKKELQSDLYARVSIELARDYLSGGFLDRAEEMLHRLVNKQLLMKESLRLLLGIYEQTKEWSKAIVVAKRLRYQGEKCNFLIAQYFCELAQQALSHGQIYEALKNYQHACLIESESARANIGIAEFHQQRGEFAKAICHYQVVFDKHPDLLSLIIEPMYACHEAIGNADAYINQLQENSYYRSFVSVILVIVKHIDKKKGPQQALARVHEEMGSSASLQLLHLSIMWSLRDKVGLTPGLRLWQEVLERHLGRSKAFSCKGCGHRHEQMRWLCNACNEWTKVVPLIDCSRIHGGVKQPIDYVV
jgi:lipopolysaccharide assembly protein B